MAVPKQRRSKRKTRYLKNLWFLKNKKLMLSSYSLGYSLKKTYKISSFKNLKKFK